jgi:hypothetical protein
MNQNESCKAIDGLGRTIHTFPVEVRDIKNENISILCHHSTLLETVQGYGAEITFFSSVAAHNTLRYSFCDRADAVYKVPFFQKES